MKKYIYESYRFDITARELLFSVIIVILMLALGLFIGEKIASAGDDANQEYEQAAKIDGNKELFEYGMRTDVGHAFIQGTLKAVDPVKLPDIDGEWFFVRKTREEYTRHTRVVMRGSGKDRHAAIEVYYTWDDVGHTDYHCEKISFLDNEFNYDVIERPGIRHLTTKNESSEVRYVYEVCDAEHEGTLYAKLGNNTVSETTFLKGKNLNEAVEAMYHRSIIWLVVFWIIWIILTGGVIFGFYYLDNEWIEDKEDRKNV